MPWGLDDVPSGMVRAGGSFAPLVFVSITGTVVLVEGKTMVSEAFRKARLKRGREEADAEWVSWLERKNEAEKEGVEFNEPPPSENR